MLLTHQEALTAADLIDYAAALGLDTQRFQGDLTRHRHERHVPRDVESADLSGVRGTPTFFINDKRHEKPADLAGLTAAIATARSRTQLHARIE